jgi:hypothetical protein
MKSLRILPAAVLLCALTAACGETPTGPQAQPGGASYDGGFTMGSGNSATSSGYTIGSEEILEDDGGYTIGSGNNAQQNASTSEADAGSGGFTMGSGN